MQLGRRPAVRLIMVLVVASAGLALAAPAALAWQARVQAVKVNQGGNPSDLFPFHLAYATAEQGAPQSADFSLKGGQTSQVYEVRCNLARAGYNECDSNAPVQFTEHATTGYSLTAVACRYTQSSDSKFSAGPPGPNSPLKPTNEVGADLATGTVSLKIHYEEWVICTFTNSPLVPPPVAPTPTPAPQAPTVLGEQISSPVVHGRASMTGASVCRTSDVVVARISGRRIASVTFFVQGRKVKTLHRPNRGRRWVLSQRVRGLPPHGPYTITARVTFARSSRTRPRTLRMTQFRCARAAASPQFTG